VHDGTQISKLLHGKEREVFGDQAYWNESHRQAALSKGIRYRINRRSPRKLLSEASSESEVRLTCFDVSRRF
jgi:IS5 family transposase